MTANQPATSSKTPAFGVSVKLRSFSLLPDPEPTPDPTPDDGDEEGDGDGQSEGGGEQEEKEETPDEGEGQEGGSETTEETEEQISDNDGEPLEPNVVYEEIEVTRKSPLTLSEASKKPRKSQIGLTALTIAVMAGVAVNLGIHGVQACERRQAEKRRVQMQETFNTIEISSSTKKQDSVVANSQSGLMGPGPSIANIGDEDFGDDRKPRRKVIVEDEDIDAIDQGKKKPAKRGRKKTKGGAKKNADNLLIQEDNAANDSWDSSRGGAKMIDMSNQMGIQSSP